MKNLFKKISFKDKKHKDYIHFNKSYTVTIVTIFITIIITYTIAIIWFTTEIKRLNGEIEVNYFKNKVYVAKIAKLTKELSWKSMYSTDMETDSSITKFVNSQKSFDNKLYIPENLINVSWKYIHDMKWWTQLIRADVYESLQELWKSFYDKFNKKLNIVSAYRSYDYQKWIKDGWCPDNLCAKAWYSEHQSWLTVDLFEASNNYTWVNDKVLNSYYIWLSDNAHIYWFHNTYQKWLMVDWYEIEPWHWRYLRVELATYLKDNNLTIAEFYKDM